MLNTWPVFRPSIQSSRLSICAILNCSTTTLTDIKSTKNNPNKKPVWTLFFVFQYKKNKMRNTNTYPNASYNCPGCLGILSNCLNMIAKGKPSPATFPIISELKKLPILINTAPNAQAMTIRSKIQSTDFFNTFLL